MSILTKRLASSLLLVGVMSCASDGSDPSTNDADETTDSEVAFHGDDSAPEVLALQAGGTINATIVVKKGQTFDGRNAVFRAGKSLGDGSQSESQKPIFKLEDGARLLNVRIGNPGADGIHTHGNVQLQNIVWEDIGEDALTVKDKGNVTINGGSASKGEDKVFQINAETTFRVSNFKANGAGKFIRQNGGKKFPITVFIDRCDISNMKEAIFRSDSSSAKVTMTNTRYSNIGKELFIVPNMSQVKQSGNSKY